MAISTREIRRRKYAILHWKQVEELGAMALALPQRGHSGNWNWVGDAGGDSVFIDNTSSEYNHEGEENRDRHDRTTRPIYEPLVCWCHFAAKG